MRGSFNEGQLAEDSPARFAEARAAQECIGFLIDECLPESLVGVAHGGGFEATHVNHLGLSGKPDCELAERITKDEFTFVTNNRVDFVRLFGQMELHSGLIVLVPNVVPAPQRALSEGGLNYIWREASHQFRCRGELGRQGGEVRGIPAA